MQQLLRSRPFSTYNFAATTVDPSTNNRAHGNCKRGFSINEAPCTHDSTHEATSKRAEAPIDSPDKWRTACSTPYADRDWLSRNCSSFPAISAGNSIAWRLVRKYIWRRKICTASTRRHHLCTAHGTIYSFHRGQHRPRHHPKTPGAR